MKGALVTDVECGSGVGIAQALATRGRPVAVASGDPAVARAAVADLVAQGARAEVVDANGEAAVAAASDAVGPLGVVVVNRCAHDVLPDTPLPDTRDVDAALALTRAAADAMEPGGGGAVLHVTFSSHFASPGSLDALAALKGAIVGATRALAVQLGTRGIRVVSVTPGLVLTPALERHLAALPPDEREAFEAHAVERTPLRRIGQVADVGALCAYLASDRASFVTGVDVVVDGGLLSLNRTFSYDPPTGGPDA